MKPYVICHCGWERRRARGVNASCETCPHDLALVEDDLAALGASGEMHALAALGR